ncbi:MAG: glycerol-3-phosphate dehydrogenase/oxidase [Myxococcota bacterium]|nr:glycerol-3-phosphate dehydrogenase/oxidase [Myxococcota bacterium]
MQLRTTNVDKLQDGVYDVLIIGGGINGAVSAAALSGRGARVALIDRGDFAGFTSQHSSNLAWGGIKYLESGELGLVRKLCKSRNHLIEAYPSTVQEIRFLTTVADGFRWPRFILYLGALLYWVMGSFFTRRPRLMSRSEIEREEPIIKTDQTKGGFEYSDAILYDNDARFVFGFVRQAMTYGCIAANYVESLGGAREDDGHWAVQMRDLVGGKEFTVKARVLVNAAGPFADLHNESTGLSSQHRHVFSKGIHLIVERLSRSPRVFTFFADDGRPFFAIPMGARTVIGTTDTRVKEPESRVTEADRDFVLDNINKRLNLPQPLTRDDVIAERCGVRPLVVQTDGPVAEGDWTKLSRKHIVEVDGDKRHVCIYGGKLTDCINVGNEVADAVLKIGINLPYPNQRWYGEPSDDIRDEYLHQARLLGLDEMTSEHASEPLSRRLWRRYGARAIGMLEDIRRNPKNAEILIETSEYIRCEIYRLARHEMVVTLDDFLRRRSKIAQVVPRPALRASRGLKEACKILFAEDAENKWRAYFGEDNKPFDEPGPST